MKLQQANDKLYSNLVDKDTVKFWRTWKFLSQSNEPLPPQIDGLSGDAHIASRFLDVFSEIYKKKDTSSHNSLRKESIFPSYY